MAENPKVTEHPVIWYQASACSGCVVAVLNGAAPTVQDLIVDQLVPGHHVSLRFQPTVMAGQGDLALEILAASEKATDGYILVVDGAIPTAARGRFGLAGKIGGETTMREQVLALAKNASAVIATGTCAAYGGIHAAAPNPTGCVGIAALLKEAGINKLVVNIPGCPPHPDWFTGTVAHALLFGLPGPEQIDYAGRPKRFFGRLLHDLCPRRGFFEAHRFAKDMGDPECMYELGCKGPWTHADCPERQFNNGTNWCVQAGAPCHGCVEPFFPDVSCPIYVKIGLAALPQIRRDQASGEMVAVARPKPAEEN
jgi:hydrogenase small subunit